MWGDTPFCVATVTRGQHAGRRAVGAGTSVKKRMKATRFAMELTLKVFDGACVIPELRHIMVRAKTALALTCNSQKAACDETRSYDEQLHGCAADSGGQNSRVDPLKARPSQIGEVIPPMDTEVIVEWAQPSARMYAGVQQSRPWLSMQAQAVSSAIQEGRPWTPLAAFPYSIPRKVPPQGGTVNPPGEEDTVDELRTLKNMMDKRHLSVAHVGEQTFNHFYDYPYYGQT